LKLAPGKGVLLIKKLVYMIIIFSLILLESGVSAENNSPPSHPIRLIFQEETITELPLIKESEITDKRQVDRMNRCDFENSICFMRCHQKGAFSPSDKTEQQWRMLIEKDGHDIFERIVWESSQQKKQILNYLIEHAGSSGAEGIGVWQ
jgi:hypothetical protein